MEAVPDAEEFYPKTDDRKCLSRPKKPGCGLAGGSATIVGVSGGADNTGSF
jgi:hypothetical protein